jgi:uncharacterized membrane protein YgcG
MRRVLFTLVAGVAVFAFVPASAIARKHHRHHHHHHHVRTHARVHKFGQFVAPGSTGTTTPAQTAGTVTSFDPTTGTLVITLNDGTTTETGVVTSETEIECQAPDSSTPMGEDGDGGSSGGGGDQGGQSGGGDNGGDGGDEQGGDEGNQSCSTANLTPGAVVLGAELQFDSSGAVWDKIELMS